MNSLMESWPRKHRITVDEYYRMAEVGLFAPDARVELIDGEIIDMAPIGIDHANAVSRLARLFINAVDNRARIDVQNPIRLDPDTEPQPDIAVLAHRTDDYEGLRPSAADVLLLIEVSDSTLGYDREVKVPLYASRGIPETWIVDLKNGQLHWYRSPRDGRYADQGSTREPGVMRLAAAPEITIDLAGLLSGQNQK